MCSEGIQLPLHRERTYGKNRRTTVKNLSSPIRSLWSCSRLRWTYSRWGKAESTSICRVLLFCGNWMASCLARLVFASIYYDLAKLSTRTRSVYRVIHSRLYLESAWRRVNARSIKAAHCRSGLCTAPASRGFALAERPRLCRARII